MNNQDQVFQEVYYTLKNLLGVENELSKRAAFLLLEDGLLAPDLPKPSREMTAPRGKVWYLDGPIGDIRSTGEDIVIFGHDYRDQSFRLILTEAEADTIARTILAAASYQEEA